MGIGQKKGFRHTRATKARIKATMKGRVPLAIHIKRQCPTCGTWMGAGNMGRHKPQCKAHAETGLFPDKSVKEMKKFRRRLRQYGLAPADFARMLTEQRGVCAICYGSNGGRYLVVDHNHKSGGVRGLLCVDCNLLLGYARDNAAVLLRAAQYLSQFKD